MKQGFLSLHYGCPNAFGRRFFADDMCRKLRTVWLQHAFRCCEIILHSPRHASLWTNGNRSKLRESVRADSGDSVLRQPKIAPIGGRYLRHTTKDFWRATIGKSIFANLGAQSTLSAALQSKFALEYLVDCLRACLSARRLHHLADKPSDCFRIRPRIRDLVRMFAYHVVYLHSGRPW